MSLNVCDIVSPPNGAMDRSVMVAYTVKPV